MRKDGRTWDKGEPARLKSYRRRKLVSGAFSIAALLLATGTAHAKGTFTNAYEACLSEGGSETCDFVVEVLSSACAGGYRSECKQLKQVKHLDQKTGRPRLGRTVRPAIFSVMPGALSSQQ
jgi:hypothetical protein